jgi:hypothetical protein
VSSPGTTIYCNRCDFHHGDALLWGRRAYLLADGRQLSIPRRYGWCEDCQRVSVVETLSQADLSDEKQKAEQELEDLFGGDVNHDEQGWQVSSLKERIDEIAELLKLLSLRTRSPCCLECGSSRVTAPLSSNREIWSAKGPVGTGFTHPGCGGELWLHKNGIRFAIRPSVRLYTPDGIFIERIFDDDR